VWDVNAGREAATPERHGGTVCSFVWSPDGTRLASASRDKTVRVWDVNTGLVVATLEGHAGEVNSCAWSPSGTLIASTSHDMTVRVWNVNTGREGATLEGHAGPVQSCAWSRDGTRLASLSHDMTVRVWLAPATTPAGMDHLRRYGEEHRLAAETSARDLAAANARARRLEGGPEALRECTLEELRQSDDVELQRRGRAGRVRPGIAFHLFPPDAAVAKHTEPAVRCVGLQQLVMRTKALALRGDAERAGPRVRDALTRRAAERLGREVERFTRRWKAFHAAQAEARRYPAKEADRVAHPVQQADDDAATGLKFRAEHDAFLARHSRHNLQWDTIKF